MKSFFTRLFAPDNFRLQVENSLHLEHIDRLESEAKEKTARIRALEKDLKGERDRYARDIGAVNDRLLELHGLKAKPAEPKPQQLSLLDGRPDGPNEHEMQILNQRAYEIAHQRSGPGPVTQTEIDFEIQGMLPNWREWIT